MGCTCEKIWRQKHSKIFHKYDSSTPYMTDDQKTIVRNNWQILKCHVANIGVITYVSLFESRPELLEVFSKFKGRDLDELQRAGLLRQHALRVMATIDKVITRLDEPSSLQEMLMEVGEHHKQYKVPPDNLQVILPHFLNAIKPHIQDNWCGDLEEAWKTLFAVILYHMKEGYNEKNHSQRQYIAKPSI